MWIYIQGPTSSMLLFSCLHLGKLLPQIGLGVTSSSAAGRPQGCSFSLTDVMLPAWGLAITAQLSQGGHHCNA